MMIHHFGVREGRISLNRMVDLLATQPAKLFGLYPRKGTVAVGADADLVVFDPERRETISAATHHSKCDYNLYEGTEVTGAPELVILRGTVIVEDGELVAHAGHRAVRASRALRRAARDERDGAFLAGVFLPRANRNCASLMRVVGSFIGARRGRLGLLAVSIALTALLSASASDAATVRAKGIDVSNWNGAINWTKVAHAGYRFAFAKATEGTAYTDKTYTTNRNGSEGAGLVFGGYHFARPTGRNLAAATASAIKQANHFLAVAGPQPGELPPVLDLEATGNLGEEAPAGLESRLARPDRGPHRRRAVPLYLAAVLEGAARRLDGRCSRRHRALDRALDVQRARRSCPHGTGTATAGGSGSGRTASSCRGSSTAATATG